MTDQLLTQQSQAQQKVDYIFKIILIGGQNVGKSSILNRYVDNAFSEHYFSTIGVDFRLKTISVEDKIVRLQIWDTAGQERFYALTSSHYKGAHGCICVYDITTKKSFAEAQRYLEQATESYNIPGEQCYIVGNKVDLGEKREVKSDEGLDLANKYNAYFCETSAKNNYNIQQVFEAIAKNLVSRVATTTQSTSNSTKKEEKTNLKPGVEIQRNRGCC